MKKMLKEGTRLLWLLLGTCLAFQLWVLSAMLVVSIIIMEQQAHASEDAYDGLIRSIEKIKGTGGRITEKSDGRIAVETKFLNELIVYLAYLEDEGEI